MNHLISLFDLFRKPGAPKIATTELDDARRKLLAHQSAYEYHLHMTDYYDSKIERLERYLKVPHEQRADRLPR
jgi:hypothetical protein